MPDSFVKCTPGLFRSSDLLERWGRGGDERTFNQMGGIRMRLQHFTVHKRSVIRTGAAIGLILCLALQTAGCSPSGSVQETKAQTTAEGTETKAQTDAQTGAQTDAQTGAQTDAQTGAQTDAQTGAEAGASQAGDGIGTSQADDQAAGEGDAGIEPQPGKPLKSGNKAPDFTAELIDGSTVTLSDFKGKPVIINFWATWCGPCVKEMPAFERLKENYGDEIGILAVNCGEDADTIKDFADANGYTFPIALDEEYQVSMLYPTNSIPYTVVIDGNGKVTHVSSGAVDADTMYERYKEALGL
ncbi:Thiol-disulfide oxidoreductase resA [uncultured Clostridium sp.]|nr:Thiol-disulfide oxidoreductase resA [uncultured Clostridium sp.]